LIFGGSLVLWAPCISFIRCIAGKDFLLFCGWTLQLRGHFFCCAKAFLISCSRTYFEMLFRSVINEVSALMGTISKVNNLDFKNSLLL
jgi:hypothetical protein